MDLQRIFSLKEKELITEITGLIGVGRTDKDNYLYYERPESPILLQAHIDSLATYNDKYKLRLSNHILRASGVLGADDRAGVFSLLQITKICNKKGLILPNLIFTNYEESGGGGMKAFVKASKKKDFSHIKIAIAIDRRGCNDYVTYVDIDDEVKKYIEDFGFCSSYGSYNDIKEFSEFTKIPSVNLSCGYYNQHQKDERLHVDEMELTIKRVVRIIENPIEKLYECRPKWSNNYNWSNRVWSKKLGRYIDSSEEEEEETSRCEICETTSEITRIYTDGYIMNLCSYCKNTIIDHKC